MDTVLDARQPGLHLLAVNVGNTQINTSCIQHPHGRQLQMQHGYHLKRHHPEVTVGGHQALHHQLASVEIQLFYVWFKWIVW